MAFSSRKVNIKKKPPEPSVNGEEQDFIFLSENVLLVVERCMNSMQAGTQMIKLRGSSKGLVRFYYLDEHKSCIRWRPSRKNEKAKISIDSIQEVCEGKQSEIFQRYADGSFDPNCCFSIYYGDHMESLDLVSSSGEEARTWITGLKYLMAGISDEDSLSKRQRTRDQWLKQTFDEADKNGDGCLSINEVLQLMHKLNVNLPRQKVKQMFKEADTDDNQGTLGFDEFCAFYKMMSTRRDLYLLMLTYSNHKDHLDPDDLKRFLEVEQKMMNVRKEYCLDIVGKFEPCPENKNQGVLGIDGFTNYMRSPAGDIFNPDHYQVNQDMTLPLSNYFIASSHNTYLMGDQLMSQSRVDMYAWVLQAGCRCVEVDCWDGPDGEPIVHHGYTLTSKILFKDVIETINKYAFIKNDYPVILSIENHCSVVQQKKMAQYLIEILGDQLNLSDVVNEDSTKLPSPQSLRGKILVKGKKLPASISDDAEEGDVSDEDSADEIDDDCKLINGDWKASANRKQVENIAKKKLDSLLKESKIRDCEDPNNFTVTTLPPSGKHSQKQELKKKCSSGSKGERALSKTEEEVESGEEPSPNKRHSRSLMGSFSKHKKKGGRIKKCSSLEEGDESLDRQGSLARAPVHYSRINRQKKTMKLSRALSDLVKYTKSVGIHDVETEISCSWQVSSFSETKAHQILQQKPAQFVRFNQHQLSRIYPSSYRVDSSNYNPQPFWNAGCQLVALNYQSEGRMLQLNRAKFNSNGICGYVLKPKCMCQGAFNPNSEDPLPGQMKKQLVLRIISGQQLPKPKDSMLGDRGEIIDPFVEVELIGLPVDCFKEQTRVVDDNGFNPMWEETLVFTVHMPEISLIRFLVWDHDPIGRDFIGQRTLSFSSMMPGYRHVYLEGMEEASIFVHVAINDISGKVKQAAGLKGLFLRNPKQASLDSHAAGQLHQKHSISSHILRRTASAPTKGQQKNKKGFPEIAIDSKDNSSEGPSEDRETDDSSLPRFEQDPESASPTLPSWDGTNVELNSKSLKGKRFSSRKSKSHVRISRCATFSEPQQRTNKVAFQDSTPNKPGVFARCAMNGSGSIGMATNCIRCMIGSKESPDLECKRYDTNRPIVSDSPVHDQYSVPGEERLELQYYGITEQPRRQQKDLLAFTDNDDLSKNSQSFVIPGKKNGDHKCAGMKSHPRQRWQCLTGCTYGSTINLVPAGSGSVSSNSSSLESLGSPELSKAWHENSRRQAGTLQREMNALFVQKLEEIRSKSPIFFTDPRELLLYRSASSLCSLETIKEEPLFAKEKSPSQAFSQPVDYLKSCESSVCEQPKESLSENSNPAINSENVQRPSKLNVEPTIIKVLAISNEPNPNYGKVNIGKAYNDRNGKILRSVNGKNDSTSLIHSSQIKPGMSLLADVSKKGNEQCPVKSNQAAQSSFPASNQSIANRMMCTNLTYQQTRPTPNMKPSIVPPVQRMQYDRPDSKPSVVHDSKHTPVRRTKSEGYVVSDCSALSLNSTCQSPVAELYSDATVNDRIWSKLELNTHRDSMSSSSSKSSNDTVIDLSLPNLARKSLLDLDISDDNFENIHINNTIRPRSATSLTKEMSLGVMKSKSNPNLVLNNQAIDELSPRPLARSPVEALPPLPRRNTWNRLYVNSLKQTNKKPPHENTPSTNQSMSKSLGDLTSDDISCNFESKYRIISRGFITRSMRAQRRPTSVKGSVKSSDSLTEQLKKLTSFQKENDITSPTEVEPVQCENEDTAFLRRTSSRSQSRVRYIANRAKQAQERQRLQNMCRINGNSIEERGNPEGACAISKGFCMDSLSPTQFTPETLDKFGT
ncbi:1-phosphatidylinositol 4,5-bisphosphate phosphodiesterase eta-2 isoform X3 [Xenopus laevis]|uniref:Phosphoinositide phospholipase C n=1 Tax=Xenopus laevis TaxID=8355 RepID=A0A8J1LEC6_XENLA|nr:1-phosphatidylinositol 4,5-bisphosphate phosphodiesterase eta-2 isoform X3 [Xenopus laevis]